LPEPIINSLSDFSPDGLSQLRLWLETFLLPAIARGGSGGGIQFNKDNEGGYLDVTTNDPDPGSPAVGMRLSDTTSGGIAVEATSGKVKIDGAVETDINTVLTGNTTIGNTGGPGRVTLQAGSGQIYITTSTLPGANINIVAGDSLELQGQFLATMMVGANSVSVIPSAVKVHLDSTESFFVENHSGTALLTTHESTGVTTGTFDGGSA
jgi:hypothetical protein